MAHYCMVVDGVEKVSRTMPKKEFFGMMRSGDLKPDLEGAVKVGWEEKAFSVDTGHTPPKYFIVCTDDEVAEYEAAAAAAAQPA